MTTKHKTIITAIALLAAFAAGRWAAPEKVRIETKTVEVEKKVDKVKTDTDRHKETVTTQVVRPDGSKEVTTKTTEDTTRRTDTKEVTQDTKISDTVKEVTRGTSKVSLSALAGISATSPSNPPVFGLALSKPILGPITVGVWGLSSGILGASLGFTF